MDKGDLETTPLMVASGVPVPEPIKTPQREWRGKWWHIFGDFSGQDVSACCLAWKFPCIAWAWNSERGLQLSFVRELVRFVLLSVALFIGLHLGCCLVMATLCPQAMPPPHEHGERPEHFHPGPEEDDEHPGLPQECLQRIIPAYLALFALAISAAICLMLYAARRRTALRERFGIKGCKGEDIALYLCCAPCAIAQETRTLMHEQVHQGVWYGALPGVQAPPALAAPACQKMGCGC